MKPGSIFGRQPATAIGRTNEVRLAVDRVLEGGLITLVGVGGVGKTTLAADIAHEAEPDFDRLVAVELAPVGDALGLHRVIASAAGLDVRTEHDELISALSSRPTLLVIDNCEHVVDVVGPFCDALQSTESLVTVLATSRRPLALAHERLIDVEPLDIPTRKDSRPVESTGAGQLLIERVRQLISDFDVTPVNRPVVTEICELSSGIPLVLELAAALVRSQPLTQIVDALEHATDAFTPRSLQKFPDRHKSVAASVAWSLQFLDHASLEFLGRVCAFSSGFSAEDAIAVAPLDGGCMPAHMLDTLVDHSLVRLDVDAERYGVLDVIRHAVLARLTPTELSVAHAAVARRCLDISTAIARGQYDEDPLGTFRRSDDDLANLAHVARRYEQQDDREGLRSLVGPVATWWVHRMPVNSATWWESNFDLDVSFDLATSAVDPLSIATSLDVNVTTAAAVWLSHQGDEERALRLAHRARKSAEHLGETRQAVISAIIESNSQLALGDKARSIETLSAAMSTSINNSFPYGELLARLNMARICPSANKGGHLTRALDLAELGFPSLEGVIYAELGLLALEAGDGRAALENAERGLRSAQRNGHSEAIGSALCGLAEVCAASRKHARAADLFAQARELATETSHFGLRERAQSGLDELTRVGATPATHATANNALVEQLSDRELSVARLLRGDLTQREIGEELYIAPSTVKSHVKSIYRKLGVSKRSHAITRAAELGLFG